MKLLVGRYATIVAHAAAATEEHLNGFHVERRGRSGFSSVRRQGASMHAARAMVEEQPLSATGRSVKLLLLLLLLLLEKGFSAMVTFRRGRASSPRLRKSVMHRGKVGVVMERVEAWSLVDALLPQRHRKFEGEALKCHHVHEGYSSSFFLRRTQSGSGGSGGGGGGGATSLELARVGRTEEVVDEGVSRRMQRTRERHCAVTMNERQL